MRDFEQYPIEEPGADMRDAAAISKFGKIACAIYTLVSGATTGLMMFGNAIHDNPIFEEAKDNAITTVIAATGTVGFAGLQRFFQNRADRIQNAD